MPTVTPSGSIHPASAASLAGYNPPAAVVSPPAEPAATDPYTNPQVQVDPTSGAVLLEYRDSGGKLLQQVPSEYQLRSYQAMQRGQSGPVGQPAQVGQSGPVGEAGQAGHKTPGGPPAPTPRNNIEPG